MTEPLHRLADLPWEDVSASLERKVVHGQRMSVTNYRFGPGGRFPNHVHAQEQITYCLDGALEFVVEGQSVPVRAGELVVIPSGVEHSAESPAGAVVLSVVSPSRAATDGGIEMRE